MRRIASSALLVIDSLVDLPVLIRPGTLRMLLSLVLLRLLMAKLVALLVLVLAYKLRLLARVTLGCSGRCVRAADCEAISGVCGRSLERSSLRILLLASRRA